MPTEITARADQQSDAPDEGEIIRRSVKRSRRARAAAPFSPNTPGETGMLTPNNCLRRSNGCSRW